MAKNIFTHALAYIKYRYSTWTYNKKVKKLKKNLQTKYKVNVMDSLETLEYIKKTGCSVARYGDGEFSLIFEKEGHGAFQTYSDKMANHLAEVFQTQDERLLVCFPRLYYYLDLLRSEQKRFFEDWLLKYMSKISPLLLKSKKYGDAMVSRPYTWEYSPIDFAGQVFDGWKSVWKDRDILIIEGEKSRLGIGNDLFDGAKSIKRILGPARSAYDKFDDIVSTVKEHYNGELVLIALGPTATVLAGELYKYGMQAIDIGHIDISYEWFLRRSKAKEAIPGKFTNEAVGGDIVEDCLDERYLSQIVAKVI